MKLLAVMLLSAFWLSSDRVAADYVRRGLQRRRCKSVLHIFAYGANNPSPGNSNDNEIIKSSAPLCMGGNANNFAKLVFNSNTGTGGAIGSLDSEAANTMQRMIEGAWKQNYTKVKISSHSNGVITAHAAWQQAKTVIEQSKFKDRNSVCGTMTIDMLHMQAAVSEYPDLISPVDKSMWLARDGEALLAEVKSVGFLFNSGDWITWDSTGMVPIGRREVVPWVIDNQQKAVGVIKGRASIRCQDDSNSDSSFSHSSVESVEHCPPKAPETHPYDPSKVLDQCDYSLNPCSFWAYDKETPEGVCYQIW